MNKLAARAMIIKQAQLEKEAINLRKTVAGAGMLASLLNPMKSFADDVMLAEAKILAAKMRPNVTKQLDEVVGSLGFSKRMGANMYGMDSVAKDLARAQSNMSILNKYRMPPRGGKALKQEVDALRKNVLKTEDVDLSQASNMYDKIQKYVATTNKDIKNFVPVNRRLASK